MLLTLDVYGEGVVGELYAKGAFNPRRKDIRGTNKKKSQIDENRS